MPSPQILLKQMDWMLSKPGWLPAYSLSLVQIGSKWSNNTTNDILGALFEYSVILLRMKIKTIRQIRKCLNGNLAAYLAPLANPLSSNVAVGNGINRQTQGTNPRNKYKYTFKLDLSEQKSTFFLICTTSKFFDGMQSCHFFCTLTICRQNDEKVSQ